MKLILLLFCVTAISLVGFTQTTKLGAYVSPEFNFPMQRPNAATVKTAKPRIGLSFGGLVDLELKEKWHLRTGLGFTSSSYETVTSGRFENDIDPSLGFRTNTKYVFQSIAAPIVVVYRDPESIVGMFGGVDLTTMFNHKVDDTFTFGSKTETTTSLFFNPALSLGLQFRFRLTAQPIQLMIEPYSQLYLRSTGIPQSTLLSTGLRFAYLRTI